MNIKYLVPLCIAILGIMFGLTYTILKPSGPEVFSGPAIDFIASCRGKSKEVVSRVTSNYGGVVYFDSEGEEVTYIKDTCKLFRI